MKKKHFHSGIHVRSVMENTKRNGMIDSMILGLSHAEVGILPERLADGNVVNLAVSSQDLYYNYATLQYCREFHFDQIRNLSFIVLDILDYICFNFDVSMCREIANYIRFGGIEDPHNYSKNKHFTQPWEKLVRQAHSREHTVATVRTRIVTDKDIARYPCKNAVRVKRFEDTIRENKEIFLNLLRLAKEINPSVQITCVIMPHYIETRKRLEDSLNCWQDEYLDIIRTSQETIPFLFLDYTCHDIGKVRSFYYDATHFNTAGAEAFTSLLRKDMGLD